jgi:hypothetical protein
MSDDVLIYVQPRASKTEVVGLHGAAIKIRVAAPPVDGEANAELVRFLAKQLGVRRADIMVLAGASGRTKRVRITGVERGTSRRLLTSFSTA